MKRYKLFHGGPMNKALRIIGLVDPHTGKTWRPKNKFARRCMKQLMIAVDKGRRGIPA